MQNEQKSPLLVLIPAYNEEKSIVSVIEDLQRNCPQYDYLIINDGSTDHTLEFCHREHYRVLDLPVNLGLAGAFQAGMRYALKNGYEYAMQFDGDGQHLAEYIPDLFYQACVTQCDIVIGSRYIEGKKGWSPREIGSRLISGCIWLTTRNRIKDPTSGMRMYKASVMENLAMQLNYDPEPDTLAALLKGGAICSEVPVQMKERVHGVSYLNFANSIKYMIYTCVSILILHWLR